MKKPVITVVGSINMDMFILTDKRPKAGETVLGKEFYMSTGGKGANQAVAAARLGAQVNMIGRIGEDSFGTTLQEYLNKEKIFLDGVETVTHGSSGVAVITLSEGDNSIIVHQGANLETTREYVKKYEALIAKSDVVLTQLEIPIEAVEETIALCTKYRTPIILNPAPMTELPTDFIQNVDYMTPNELEYSELSDGTDLEMYTSKLIITKGKEGVFYFENGIERNIPSHSVEVVDTTGAGDTFNGAFAYAIAMENDIANACEFANAAAALSVQRLGAQAGMPTIEEIHQFMERNVQEKK